MRKLGLIGTSTLALMVAATPAAAQDSGTTSGTATSGTTQSAKPGAPAAPGAAPQEEFGEDIVVTAQRQSQRLQDVPIAVSAFTAEALEEQQIENASDLQLTLPNVTFTKANFTSSSFTIRGVGDLCVGFSCDSATAIHVNDIPLLSTRLFETEYFDLERVEVLRGPQGTLYGRNATSGVVNFITARPDLSGFGAAGTFEYGNYDSIKATGMINVPFGESIGVRVAGYYVNRDGYTKNTFDDSRIDDRDLYAVRGTLRFEPTPDTTLDLIGYYFREKDNRSRIQKQLCEVDQTAILGCTPTRLGFGTALGDSTLGATISSRQFFALASLAQGGVLGNFGISDLRQGTSDIFAGVVNSSDLRELNVDFTPTYFAEEMQFLGKLEHDFGPISLGISGGWTKNKVDSRADYTLSTANPFGPEAIARANAALANPNPVIARSAAAVLSGSGASTQFCVSEPDGDLSSQFTGSRFGCAVRSIDFDRSRSTTEQWSVEAKLASDFDGPFNFLVGGIYVDQDTRDGDYFVVSSGVEYASAILGAAQGAALGPAVANGVYLGPPYFSNTVPEFGLKSYGLFGEAYFEASERLKFTAGIRYSNDEKFVRSRSPLLEIPTPIGTLPYDSPAAGAPRPGSLPQTFFGDADPSQAGYQPFRETTVKFDEFTGRAVVDFKVTDDNLLYASYSRGYKSGGVNPPVDPTLTAPVTFDAETINAYEIGSKNTFLNGQAQINLAAFYYDYKNLQISRILNRTSFNDNTDAEVYGVELETILRPTRALQFNIAGSYLKTKIKDLQLTDPRDPSGGRSDVTIIKDVQTAANCVIIPTAGASGRNLVRAVNAFLNGATGAANGGALFQSDTVAVPGTTAQGAFSSCNLLAAAIAGAPYAPGSSLAALAPVLQLFGFAPGPLGFQLDPASSVPVLPTGVLQDLSGNQLPNAPKWKVSVGGQYTFEFDNGMSLVARADYAYTGESFSRPQNRNIDQVDNYEIINAQVQLNGPDDRWFVRGFVQNLQNNDSITGQYLTDPSTGLFTNVFTLEPRRYGVGVGFKF